MENAAKRYEVLGEVKSGHFCAQVTRLGAGRVRCRVEMTRAMEAERYDAQMEYRRWEEELSQELRVLGLKADNLEFECRKRKGEGAR